ENPSRVSRLILVDAAMNFGISAPTFNMRLVDALLSIRPLRTALVSATLGNPSFTPTLLRMFVYDPKSATDYWISVYQKPIYLKGAVDAFADWLPGFINERDTSKSGDPASYASLHVPALVLWGDKDSVTPLPQGEYLASIIPGAKLEILHGVGHLPPVEDN